MAHKHKTINGTDPVVFDKEVSEFLATVGDNLLNIAYTSAALLVPVQDKPSIQHINKQQVKTAISIINTCYITYNDVAQTTKQ